MDAVGLGRTRGGPRSRTPRSGKGLENSRPEENWREILKVLGLVPVSGRHSVRSKVKRHGGGARPVQVHDEPTASLALT